MWILQTINCVNYAFVRWRFLRFQQRCRVVDQCLELLDSDAIQIALIVAKPAGHGMDTVQPIDHTLPVRHPCAPPRRW